MKTWKFEVEIADDGFTGNGTVEYYSSAAIRDILQDTELDAGIVITKVKEIVK